MNSLEQFISRIGKARIYTELGLVPSVVTNAIVRGRFPASWYPTIKRIAAEEGVEVPNELFSWRKPEDTRFLTTPK